MNSFKLVCPNEIIETRIIVTTVRKQAFFMLIAWVKGLKCVLDLCFVATQLILSQNVFVVRQNHQIQILVSGNDIF